VLFFNQSAFEINTTFKVSKSIINQNQSNMKIHDKTSATSSLRTKWWQKLGFLLAAGLFVLGSSSTQAQVSYSESWDVPGLAGWVNGAGTGGTFARFTGATDCDGNGSVRANQWSAGHTREFISPLTGTSNGAVTTLTFDYKYAIWSANTTGASATSFNLEVFWGTSASGPWNSLGIIDAGNHTVSGTCAQGPGTYTFTPNPGDPVYIRFFSTWLAQDYYVNLDNVVVEELLPVCTSVPAPGNTESTVLSACTGTPFTLSLENPPGASGISFQWQTSPDGTTWTNAGPDAATWETTQSEATWYRCEVTCTGEGTGTSTPIEITNAPFSDCYCTDVGPTSTADSELLAVTLNGDGGSINNNTPCPAELGLQDFTAQSAALILEEEYTIDLLMGQCGTGTWTNTAKVWIDYNQDGVFDEPGERLGFVTGATSQAGVLYSINFTVPAGALTGATTMRVVQRETGTESLVLPCGTYSWGSAHDYTVDIVAPVPCVDSPDPGNTLSSAALVCSDDNFTVSLQNPTSGLGITYQWQTSPDGSDWTDAGPNSSSWQTSQTETTWYRCIVTCNTEDPEISTPVEVVSDIAANCLCEPLYTTGTASGDLISRVQIVGTTLDNDVGFTAGQPSWLVFIPPADPSETAELSAGTTYPLTVSTGEWGSQGVAVWVDFNGDGVFSPSERVGATPTTIGSGFTAGQVNATATFPISLPCDPVPGDYVMRVRCAFSINGVDLDPCASYTWGQAHDYQITILPPPPCPSPSNLVAGTVGASSVELLWDQGCEEVLWDVHATTVGGGEPVGAPSDPGVQIGHEVTGLDAITSYDFYVRAVCGQDTVSGWIGPVTITTSVENNNCAEATPLTVQDAGDCAGNFTAGSTANATESGAPEPPCIAVANLIDVYYSFNSGDNTTIQYNIQLGTMTAFGVELLDACSGNSIDCADGELSSIFPVDPFTDYILRVVTLENLAGTFDICVQAGPDNPLDECDSEFTLAPGSPINDLATTTSVLTVGPQASGSIITDLNVVVDISHTWVSDLTITLTSPCGTEVVLMDNVGPCAALPNMTALFDDSASDNLDTWCAVRYGPVIPQEALSVFMNEPIEGDWTLSVFDGFFGDQGTLDQWCLVPTLQDLCVAPQIIVTDFTDTTIEVDILYGGCFDTGNYESFDINWGSGSVSGVTTLPYEITGLDPGTNYNVTLSAVCTGNNPSGASGVSQYTLDCTVEESCTYELTLANSSGTGFDGAFVQVNNGWFTADYTLGADESENTFIIQACPGNELSVNLSNGGNGALASNYSISLVNANDVEVYAQNGPPEALLLFLDDGCPDCAAVQNIGFTRLASDLVEVTWSNIELTANVDDILVEVYIDDFFGPILVGTTVVAAGSTSASVTLDNEYPFELAFVSISTNCTNQGVGVSNSSQFVLPECSSADQCEYVFNMTSNDDGWEGNGLDVLIDGSVNIEVTLATGTAGSQTIFACPNGTIDVTASLAASTGYQGPPFCDQAQGGPGFPGLQACEDVVCAADGFCCTTQWDGFCASAAASQSECADCLSTAPPGFVCSSASFDLVLNPSTDNVTVLDNTDFCPYDNNDVVFSGATCPSCFGPIGASAGNPSSESIDISWISNNPAGTDYTVYVGLPGFTPGVDEISTASGTTIGTGAQGPVTVFGLDPITTYEAIVIEDCGNDPSDLSNTVTFSTTIANDDCASLTPVSYTSPDVLVINGSSVGASDNSLGGSYGIGQAWEAVTIVGCAQNLAISFCGTSPAMSTAFTGISTGCPAEFPTNYLVADDWNWIDCGDGNPTLYYDQLLAGTYYIPVIEGHTYTLTITSDECSGCTDPAAINFDPNATVDDGSCIIPDCDFPQLSTTVVNDCENGTFQVLLNIGTEGDADDYDVYIDALGSGPFCDQAQGTPGFPSDPTCEASVCAADGFCCSTSWDGLCAGAAATDPACANCLSTAANLTFIGTFIGGTSNIDVGSSFTIGTSIDVVVEHNDDATCNQSISAGSNVICGCTDPSAGNFNPLADEDDGSCIFPPANSDCSNATTLNPVQYPATNNTLGTLLGATASGSGSCSGTAGPDVFFTFNVPAENHYWVNLNPFGGFIGGFEVLDACGGTVIECAIPGTAGPFCDAAQGGPGFPSDPACETAVCAADGFCCSTSWDGICAGIAASSPACTDCVAPVGGVPSSVFIENLPAGDYVVRVQDASGASFTTSAGNFLINVQSFPTAQVQANPANFLYACNTTDRQLEDIVGASPQSGQLAGILDYEWLYYPQNEGPASGATWVRGAPNYSTILTWLGMEYGKTYNVYVRLLMDIPGLPPTWGVFQINNGFEADPSLPGASICTIGLSNNVTMTQLRPNFSPTNAQGNDYAMCNIATAFTVAEAQNYEWEFDNGIDPPVYYLRGAGNPHVKLSWVNCLKPNSLYQVRVRANVAGL